MRYFQIILAVLLSSYCQGQEYYYVTAKSGLNVRSESTLKAKKTAKLPYGTLVEIVEETDKKLTVKEGGNTISGVWVKVAYNNGVYFISSETEPLNGEGYVFSSYLQKLRDDSLIDTVVLDEEVYNILKEQTVDPNYNPIKIRNLDSIKDILNGRVEWGTQYEEYDRPDAIKSIKTSNGQLLMHNQWSNEIEFSESFCGYFPDEDILLMAGGHSSDVTFSIRTGETEWTAGNPDYIIPSPENTMRLNAHNGGHECNRYLLQKKANGTFEYLTEFISPYDICTIEEFCWLNEKTFIYKVYDYTKSFKILYYKGNLVDTY